MNTFFIVNATALDNSGGLSILRQFVANIPSNNRKWLIFVSPLISINSENRNVRIEPIKGVKSLPKRLWWDTIGLKKWLKKNEIKPIASISLQNTGFNVGKTVPSYIYYHQSIPFSDFSWNPFKRKERTFWFYKNIYPLIVKLFLKTDTRVLVQLDYIRKGVAKKFNRSETLIDVFIPSVTILPPPPREHLSSSETFQLLYPAMPHFYKNHSVIDEALKYTDIDASVLFTLKEGSTIFKDKRIRLIDTQSYENICKLYYTCDALLFPSYIETFGLPLLEAATTGMPIIAADLPYAREVLDGYEGVTYVQYNDPQAWAKAIENLEKGKRFKPIDISNRPGWKELFEQILKKT